MTKLSSAAWVVHNVGLGASFGGNFFGKVASNPKLGELSSAAERGRLLNTVWNRYNVVNVASFAAAAATWFPGRLGLSGKEVDETTRNLVLAKDLLFGAGTLIGGTTIVQGLKLSKEAPDGAVPISTGTTPSAETSEKAATLLRSVNVLGNLNIAVTGGILGITSVLAMKASESTLFSGISRLLP